MAGVSIYAGTKVIAYIAVVYAGYRILMPSVAHPAWSSLVLGLARFFMGLGFGLGHAANDIAAPPATGNPGSRVTFSHPDYTVGPGFAPVSALRLAALVVAISFEQLAFRSSYRKLFAEC